MSLIPVGQSAPCYLGDWQCRESFGLGSHLVQFVFWHEELVDAIDYSMGYNVLKWGRIGNNLKWKLKKECFSKYMFFHNLIELKQTKKRKRKDDQCTHLLLQKFHYLLDTVAHWGQVGFKHKLGHFRFLIIRIDACEPCEADGWKSHLLRQNHLFKSVRQNRCWNNVLNWEFGL